jgi:hypothetical protein
MRLSILYFAFAATAASAGELVVSPAVVVLTGAKATQQLLVYETANGRVVADRSEGAKFTSSDPKIATVNAEGKLVPTGNGETTIIAIVEGKKATATVRVEAFEKPTEWSFTNHVQATLTRTGCNSGACHGALAGKGGFKLSLRGYDHDADHFGMTRQALARRIDREKPEESLLLKKAARLMPHGGGTRFDSESEYFRVLLDWIRAGAPGPRNTDAVAKKLEILPRAALLKPKDSLRFNVLATFSDGSVQDVTRWVKFSSSDDQTATVDEDGKATVAGKGEAAISAIYGTLVATGTITVPFSTTVDAKVFATASKVNLIDEHVLAKLQLLGLPPSPNCTDEEFVRRAFLDTCGVLPKPEEVAKFLAEKAADKRAKLIEQLLGRPEYVDYWSHKWCDLLLVSTRKLPQQAAWGFYRKIRSNVADNRPWDLFARDILTASGSTLTNGGGNYFVLHKDVTDLSEATALTFLGMSITCARCHNHPLERWTQDQYWQMANLFSRVGLKNGDRPGEVLVQSLAMGEARHLRKGVPVLPTPLDGTPLPFDSPIDRREYFADWLTNPSNPYFAKAIVNRIWRNYMGRGLVEAEDDVRETNPPTNAELLDALTKEFIAKKFDVKALMRLILNSAAYQRSSKSLPGNAEDDRFYSHYLLRRLSAEVILDAYSDISGVPTPFDKLAIGASGGSQASTLFPLGTRAMQLPDSQMISQFLDAFGRAERTLTCSCEITKDSSVAQALHLNNGQTLNDKLRDPKSVLSKWLESKTSDTEIVDRIFLLSLARKPANAERTKILKVLAEAGKAGSAARREALEDTLWAVLTGREFLFNR